MKFYIYTLGCKVNTYESNVIRDNLINNGYIESNKKAIRTNNRIAMEQAQLAKKEWLLHCDKARQPEYVSQNEMDMILDALSSWNRKKKGYSYKPTL